MVSVKIEVDALECVKLAASETGESISVYLSRIAKERAIADVETLSQLNAAKKLELIKGYKEAPVPDPGMTKVVLEGPDPNQATVVPPKPKRGGGKK